MRSKFVQPLYPTCALLVSSGASANAGAVFAGGFEKIMNGGHADGTVASGGIQLLSAGGTASGAKIIAGGQRILSGAAAEGTEASGGSMAASSGGTALGAVVASGGTAAWEQDSIAVASGTLALVFNGLSERRLDSGSAFFSFE